MRTISHDAFARFTISRDTRFIAAGAQTTCAFCGQIKQTRNGRKFLYQYFSEVDGISTRREAIPGLFCSIGCCRAYHGL